MSHFTIQLHKLHQLHIPIARDKADNTYAEGRAPLGGGAPERGNPPEGGVATLPTTSSVGFGFLLAQWRVAPILIASASFRVHYIEHIFVVM